MKRSSIPSLKIKVKEKRNKIN